MSPIEVPIFPSPASMMRRANLMTLIVDMNKISPDQRQRKQHRCINSDDDDDDESTVAVDISLQRMIKSTSRVLSDERQDLDKELQREYKSPPGTLPVSDDDDDEDCLCHEMSKLKHLEETFHNNEMAFAIDQIAYRHSSTSDWAAKHDLICFMDEREDGDNNEKDSRKGDSAFMDRIMNFFCSGESEVCGEVCGRSQGGVEVIQIENINRTM